MCGLWYNLSCCRKAIWVWRSLVARYLGVVEAVGSNPATQTKTPEREGVIVIRYYLALRGAENGVTVMVTPFFCVQG